jgi:hypothetical protein
MPPLYVGSDVKFGSIYRSKAKRKANLRQSLTQIKKAGERLIYIKFGRADGSTMTVNESGERAGSIDSER